MAEREAEKKLRSVWVGILALIAVAALVYFGRVTVKMRAAHRLPQISEHLPPSDNPLYGPAGAADLCYAYDMDGRVYEFDISERGFTNWARQRCPDAEVREIGAEPVKVRRYKWYQDSGSSAAWVTVSNGLVCTDQGKYTGQWVYAYDRDRKRAYCWSW